MKNKLLATAGAAILALSMSASASHAGFIQDGETMGVSLDSPLPEGVFFADLEDYGRADGANGGVGVNIPVILWSTPWSFYNNRLEFLAAFPFAHIDAPGTSTKVGAITFAIGPILAHDFGNGLTGGVSAFLRTPDPTSSNGAPFTGRGVAAADFRESLQYVSPAAGIFNGLTFIENGYYTSDFNHSADLAPLANDDIGGDFTIEKTFDKLTIGFTGFGHTDTSSSPIAPKIAEIQLGGLIGYDFGKFSLTGIVTRSVLETSGGVNNPAAYETRGWLRLIVPLYVAPTAPSPVVARY